MIAHCFCHPHTLVYCTSLAGLWVSYTNTGRELILHKTGRHNQPDRHALVCERVTALVPRVGAAISKPKGAGWDFCTVVLSSTDSTKVIKSLMRASTGSRHATLLSHGVPQMRWFWCVTFTFMKSWWELSSAVCIMRAVAVRQLANHSS